MTRRIEWANWDPSPFSRSTTLGIFCGQFVLWGAIFGCHQTQVQRYCATQSLKQARWSVNLSLQCSVTRLGEISPLWQKFTSLWQICDIIGLIFIIANGQILKNNLTIWSHLLLRSKKLYGIGLRCFTSLRGRTLGATRSWRTR